MYNSNLRYYAKALLGKKNDMWYFDNLLKCYSSDCREKTKNAIQFAEKKVNLNLYKSNTNLSSSEVTRVGERLRLDLLKRFKNYYIHKKLSVLIHLPPIKASVGANSFLHNLGIGLDFMGVEVNYFWDNLSIEDLDGVDIIFGIGFKNFTDNINWKLINEFKKNNSLKIFLQTTFDIENSTDAKNYIDYYKSFDIDTFYSFDTDDFNMSFGLKKFFTQNNVKLFSFEFSANPILHYPIFSFNKEFDFIFLGSTNHDKINRYFNYFKPLFIKYSGLVAGPGWPWCDNYESIGDIDRFLYSNAKTSVNLHIDTQIKYKRQLNERSYILAACGIPQIIDNVPLIKDRFNRIGLISNTPTDFSNNIKLVLGSDSLQEELAINALNEVYQKHTIFTRIVDFISQLDE